MKLVIEIEGKPEDLAKKLTDIASMIEDAKDFPNLTLKDEKAAE